MVFIVKKHESKSSIILSIIDEELEGKTITEGEKVLDLASDFYKGEKKNEEEVLNSLNKASHLNIAGKNIVTLMKKEELIDNFLEIGGVPYAQAILVRS